LVRSSPGRRSVRIAERHAPTPIDLWARC